MFKIGDRVIVMHPGQYYNQFGYVEDVVTETVNPVIKVKIHGAYRPIWFLERNLIILPATFHVGDRVMVITDTGRDEGRIEAVLGCNRYAVFLVEHGIIRDYSDRYLFAYPKEEKNKSDLIRDAVYAYSQRNVSITTRFEEGMKMDIKNVIYNPPATIVFWRDGSKTVVKCKPGEEFQAHVGLAMCIAKKTYGDSFHKVFKKWVPNEKDLDDRQRIESIKTTAGATHMKFAVRDFIETLNGRRIKYSKDANSNA